MSCSSASLLILFCSVMMAQKSWIFSFLGHETGVVSFVNLKSEQPHSLDLFARNSRKISLLLFLNVPT